MKALLIPYLRAASLLALLSPVSLFATLLPQVRQAIETTHEAATKPVAMHPANVDWAKFVEAHYAPDAKLLPPNGAIVSGRDALIAFFKGFPPLSLFKTSDLEMEGDGDTAYIRGTYEITMNPPNAAPITDKGKYVEIWRRRDGTWRCVLDIFNGDAPGK